MPWDNSDEKKSNASTARISVPGTAVADFCRRHHIRKMALFGSVLRDDFAPVSDIDVLVEFVPGHGPGLKLIDIEMELSGILAGRKVDMNTTRSISPYYRDEVLAEAEVLYDET